MNQNNHVKEQVEKYGILNQNKFKYLDAAPLILDNYGNGLQSAWDTNNIENLH